MPDCPIVETSLGKMKGKVLGKIENGKNVFLYTSIPFAKPPVGDLRFEPPLRPDLWDGVLDATKHSAAPFQQHENSEEDIGFSPDFVDHDPETFDEDCLYLSIYTSNPSKSANLPVLFWIYGGGFMVGGEFQYDARVIASLHDVIVVIPNYRVNVFGFLSFGKGTDYPGNMGIHDQLMALKWTQNHIKAFGGNPNKVTICGQSAGSYSVSFLVVSPLSKGLFHHAISHSGTFYGRGQPAESVAKPLKVFLEKLKIEETDPKLVIKKLKSLSKDEILNAGSTEGAYFGAVYDGKVFPKPIPVMKKEEIANKVPHIVGCNSTEGFGILTANFPPNFKSGITKEACLKAIKTTFGKASCSNLSDDGYEVLTKEYEKNKKDDDPKKWSKIYGEILADIYFVDPTLEALKQQVLSKGKSFMYVMTQKPQFNHTGPENARKADFCECDHGDDGIFTFGLPLTNQELNFDPKFTDDEKMLSREWIKYIVNFATNGDPNIGLPVKVKWPEYKQESKEHLFVQEPCSVGKKFGQVKYKFWSEVMDPLLAKQSDQSQSN